MVGATVGVLAPAAAQAYGVESFFAANCTISTCVAATPTTEYFTQSSGHPNFGITEFTVEKHEISTGVFAPVHNLTKLRVDVGPGVSTNPEAVPKCSVANFTSTEVEPVKHLFLAPNCAETGAGSTLIGEQQLETVLEVAPSTLADVPLTGKVYNLEQPNGLSSYFGVAVPVGEGVYVHSFLKGLVAWGSDYHDYFVIENISPGLLKSRLIFKGNIGTGGFLTNPSACTGVGPQTTTSFHGQFEGGEGVASYEDKGTGITGCGIVPFAPTLALTPATTQSDAPDGMTAELSIPQNPSNSEPSDSYLKTATVTLPEGMTLNPSAANELEACTEAQINLKAEVPVTCPAKSKIGTVTLKVPGISEAEPLEGSVYLGAKGTLANPMIPEPITGPPYTVYINAETARYGGALRVKGVVTPNEATGQLTATFAENPESPFSHLIIHFKTGEYAPLANPLTCGVATTSASFAPYATVTGKAPATPLISPFTVDSNGLGGACASPIPFALGQSTQNSSANGGAHTAYTVNLERPSGQQYLQKVSTVLPAGLDGVIPTVTTPCGEPLAAEGKCAPETKIGTATVLAGAGPKPYSFTGPVYLTGPYAGAPYGLSIAVPAVAGPFNLGTIVTRATINVNQSTARVTVASVLPTIWKGIPLRIQKISVAVEKSGYLLNPTNCSAEATETTLTSTFGATDTLSSPFQVSNCSALKFKPTFAAKAGGKTSKAGGAGIETTINQPGGEANIASVLVQLPRQLPSRLTTLQKSCPEATAAVSIYDCPPGSKVGGVRANTPLLPTKMTGSAYLVSHGGEAFPDLDLVLEADGVRVILVGHTKITKGITTTYFQTLPDVPVTSITVNLPTGPNSALAGNGNLCDAHLVMPTKITAQNGKVTNQNTVMTTPTCRVQIVGRKVVGNDVYLTVKTYAAGRISGSGPGLSKVYRHLAQAHNTATLIVPLSGAGRFRGRPFSVRVRVGFVPSSGGIPNSIAYQTVTFG